MYCSSAVAGATSEGRALEWMVEDASEAESASIYTRYLVSY